MSQYCYSPLSRAHDSIRLLRLIPNENEKADVQCELFEYSLQDSGKRTHLYEALSYVWGDPKSRRSISINKHKLLVTENLHAALLRLRDRSIVRTIWIDAICINQANKQEKEHQIQSMAKIYSQANRVIVWLGEAADDSDRAIEEIRVTASKKSTNSSNNETIQQAILKLLQRPWFRRIWVLQEVAAARHVLIMCGSAEIDGYVFCLCVELLKDFYEAHPNVQSLVRSVTYLIKGAIFRPKYTTSRSGTVSLDICPLGELIDMYYTHEATQRHDKVYALLGMSSDNLSKASLSPNYGVPWEELLERLVRFLLCEKVSVETWGDREMAVIKSKGCILGQVSSVKSGIAWDDRQNVDISFKNTPGQPLYMENWNAHWTLQASAKPIQEGDLVCLLQGASKPTIIRLCKDHFTVIMIAATPREEIGTESRSVSAPELFQSITVFPHDFLLAWDWEKPPGELQDRNEYETLIKPGGQGPEHSETTLDGCLDKATRLWNVGLILEDLEKHEEAEWRLREAIGGYERAVGKEHPHILTGMDSLALMYKKKQRWKEAEKLFVQVIQIRNRVQGADHLDTLSSMANLASTHRDQKHLDKAEKHLEKAEKLETMIYLLKRREDNAQITEEEVVQIARSFDKEVMTLLLDRRGCEFQITKGVVKAAAENKPSGKELMTLLLDRRGDKVPITEGVVKAAARNEWLGAELMTLLLDRRGNEVPITEEVIKAAAGNWWFGEEVMTLLLDRRGGDVPITEGAVKAAAGNDISGKKVMALLLERRGDEFQITKGVVKAAAKNKWSGYDVMTLLLDRRGDEIQITEEVIKAAAGNEQSGKEVMALLLERRGDEVQITEEVIKAAKANKQSGKRSYDAFTWQDE
ncbi:related to heterokaryon incompatibility protein [Phialocephala subalpina]|uniref:Related to heterokaryon incompatibility protein n=1 Tax=Phialocephala subalpina TaxID=576137 RepID=A0A1L7WZW8_9HELO|nr:related to heterokaryon incompatibility protein [Phialocephala subalpina]